VVEGRIEGVARDVCGQGPYGVGNDGEEDGRTLHEGQILAGQMDARRIKNTKGYLKV